MSSGLSAWPRSSRTAASSTAWRLRWASARRVGAITETPRRSSRGPCHISAPRASLLSFAAPRRGHESRMEIPKEQILELLRNAGDHDKAKQADQQLPDQVDTEQHAGILGQLGIDPQE